MKKYILIAAICLIGSPSIFAQSSWSAAGKYIRGGASSSGKQIYFGANPPELNILNLEHGNSITFVPKSEIFMDAKGEIGQLTSIINPDGKTLQLFGPYNIEVIDISSGKSIWTGAPSGREKGFRPIASYFFKNKNKLAIVQSNSLIVLDLSGSEAVVEFENSIKFSNSENTKYRNFIASARFNWNGSILYTGNLDGSIGKLDVSKLDSPKVLASENVFGSLPKSRDFEKSIESIVCSDDCKYIVVTSASNVSTSVIDGEALRVISTKFSDDKRFYVIPIWGGRFLYNNATSLYSKTPSETDNKFVIVDSRLRPLFPFYITDIDFPVFGYQGGVLTYKAKSNSLELIDIESRVKQYNQSIISEDLRLKKIERDAVGFRTRIKSGSECHCGLVIERKGEIALVETQIGQKWLKISQIYPPGTKNCIFVNGVLQ